MIGRGLGIACRSFGSQPVQCGSSAPRGGGEFRVQKEGFRVQLIFNEKLAGLSLQRAAVLQYMIGRGIWIACRSSGCQPFQSGFSTPRGAGEFRVQKEGFRVQMNFQ